ncbi:LexA family transcriptional regulator [uncultured Adlercreutzia sp.]|uniref:LexA family transcriptional regulator n=1 Tax=uncultured Adlercreutzia sp. TaxID=875803 RepID=UPI0026F3C93F|nr:LexA family transcriptional regulator [uncultured Adlercreutzia sp.]
MSIGDNIRALRRRKGLSQAELAAQLNVAKETVSRWESGRTFIRQAHLERLVELFDISRDDIMSEEWGLGHELGTARAAAPVAPTSREEEAPPSPMAPPYPVYKIARSGNGTTLRHCAHAFAPPDVAENHRVGFFVRMDYREMTKLYPVGSLLLVDQHVKPYNGCTVVAMVDNATVVVRRYLAGNDTIVLSSWSYDSPSPDLMLDKRRVRILGTVVWFQANHDLSV